MAWFPCCCSQCWCLEDNQLQLYVWNGTGYTISNFDPGSPISFSGITGCTIDLTVDVTTFTCNNQATVRVQAQITGGSPTIDRLRISGNMQPGINGEINPYGGELIDRTAGTNPLAIPTGNPFNINFLRYIFGLTSPLFSIQGTFIRCTEPIESE